LRVDKTFETQESGYGDRTVRFQRHWKIKCPRDGEIGRREVDGVEDGEGQRKERTIFHLFAFRVAVKTWSRMILDNLFVRFENPLFTTM